MKSPLDDKIVRARHAIASYDGLMAEAKKIGNKELRSVAEAALRSHIEAELRVLFPPLITISTTSTGVASGVWQNVNQASGR